MNNYIFYTTDGHTQDDNQNDTNNCQVIGWQEGETPEKALEKLEKEISIGSFENIHCQELKSTETFYL